MAYREVQRVRTIRWIWLVIVPAILVAWYAFIQQLVLGHPFGTDPMTDGLLVVVWFLFGIASPVGVFICRMITEVREDGLYVRFIPFHRKFQRYPFRSIARYEARKYRPLLEYGGWGIRWGLHGKAYNVRGNRGVQLELTNGRRILIGSQDPDKLVQAMERQAAP